MVNNLVFRWPKPTFCFHGSWYIDVILNGLLFFFVDACSPDRFCPKKIPWKLAITFIHVYPCSTSLYSRFVSVWSYGFANKLSFPSEVFYGWWKSESTCGEHVSFHFYPTIKTIKTYRWLWWIGRFFDGFKNVHHDSLFFVWQEKSGLLLVIGYPTRMIFALQVVNRLASDNTELSHIFLTYP